MTLSADRESVDQAGAGIAWGVYSLRGRGVADPLAATAGNFARAAPLALAASVALLAQVHADASDLLNRHGLLVEGANGPQPNPMIKVAKDAAVTMRQISDVLGLNPLARIRGNLMEAATGSMVLDIQKRLRELMAE